MNTDAALVIIKMGYSELNNLARPWAATKLEVLCGLQSFNTEVTATLCALRVEGLTVTEYTEPLPGNDMLIRA